ncbi:hypothetical protein ACQKEY_12660 [Lysinibacillus fusiformis]|uniref:hypothetical protein n=1 Tax=Lysinibacillus fusiformis TaxID=28031 RepID=UPI003D052E94
MVMITSDLLNTLKVFSEVFNIPPPWSNDIGQWWHQVVNDMDVELLLLLYNNNVLGRYNNKDLIFMNSLLSDRISDLETAI